MSVVRFLDYCKVACGGAMGGLSLAHIIVGRDDTASHIGMAIGAVIFVALYWRFAGPAIRARGNG